MKIFCPEGNLGGYLTCQRNERFVISNFLFHLSSSCLECGVALLKLQQKQDPCMKKSWALSEAMYDVHCFCSMQYLVYYYIVHLSHIRLQQDASFIAFIWFQALTPLCFKNVKVFWVYISQNIHMYRPLLQAKWVKLTGVHSCHRWCEHEELGKNPIRVTMILQFDHSIMITLRNWSSMYTCTAYIYICVVRRLNIVKWTWIN